MPRTLIALNSAALWAALFVCSARSGAEVISANLPDGSSSGLASDAYMTSGAYASATWGSAYSLANRIVLTQECQLTQLTFWGLPILSSPVAGFQLQILTGDFSTTVVNQVWSSSELAIEPVGDGWTSQYAGLLSGAAPVLGPGTYWLNLGALAGDQHNGSPWAWCIGQSVTPSLGFVKGNLPPPSNQWTPWMASSQPLSCAYILFGQPVPGPGALAATTLAAMFGARRRRRPR